MRNFLRRIFGGGEPAGQSQTTQVPAAPARPPAAPANQQRPQPAPASQAPRGMPIRPGRGGSNQSPIGQTLGAQSAGVPGGSAWCKHDRLVGLSDPLTLQELRAGDSIQLCSKCCTPYTLESFSFLRSQNQGRCTSCRRADQFIALTLGATNPAIPSSRPQPFERSIIGIAEVPKHVDQVIDFEGVVTRVHRSRAGTHFVKFTHDRSPIDGFKLVIYQEYESAWTARGTSPASYDGKRIRVHGLVKNHPTYGLEIIVYSPDAITVVPPGGLPATNITSPVRPRSPITWRRSS